MFISALIWLKSAKVAEGYIIATKISVIMSAQIGLITFDEQVNFVSRHPCYQRDLAVMTPTNKKVLTEYASYARVSAGISANFSNALTEAFRLLTDHSNDTEPGSKTRGLWSAGHISRKARTIPTSIHWFLTAIPGRPHGSVSSYGVWGLGLCSIEVKRLGA